MAFKEINGAKLGYVQFQPLGDGPRQDLILCHGLASSMGFWPVELIYALRQQFRVTMFDMRGHGRSKATPGGYTARNLGRDIAEVIKTSDLTNPHVMAHSFGGVAVLSMLAEQGVNVKSLVLLDSQIGLGRHQASASGLSSADKSLVEALAKIDVAFDPSDPFAGVNLITALSKRRLADLPIESDDDRVQFLVQSLPHKKAERWIALVNDTSALEDMVSFDGLTSARLAQIETPVLALFGGNSAAVHSGRILQDAMPACIVDLIPNAGHFFVATRTTEVVTRCLSFWERDRLDLVNRHAVRA